MSTPPKKKLLIATDYYHPHWTGISKAMRNLVAALTPHHEVTVLTVRYSKSLPAEEMLDGARIVRCEPLLRVSRASYSLAAVGRFITEASKHDTVLINSPCSNILPYAVIARFLGRRLVVFHQGDLRLREGFANRIVEAIFWSCTTIAALLADAVSTYTADYGHQSKVLGRFSKKFRPMLMPITVPKINGSEVPARLQPIIDAKRSGAFIYGFAGRFVWEKGFDVLFTAIPDLIRRMPNARFFFAGETNVVYENFFAENQERLKNVSQYVTILGLLNEQELAHFYDLIDAIVLPSRSDCCPLVQMEACLCGRPSVVTDIPGARVVVLTTGFGLIVKPEDPVDLAAKLAELPQRIEELRPNHPKVLEFLDYDGIVRNAESILFG